MEQALENLRTQLEKDLPPISHAKKSKNIQEAFINKKRCKIWIVRAKVLKNLKLKEEKYATPKMILSTGCLSGCKLREANMTSRAIKTLTDFNPQILTRQYLDGTLPKSWYWFAVAGNVHIGKYLTAHDGLEPVIQSATNSFVGTLKTITILAEIPDIYDLLNQVQDHTTNGGSK